MLKKDCHAHSLVDHIRFFMAGLVDLAHVGTVCSLSLESQPGSPLYASFINLIWGTGVKSDDPMGSDQQEMSPSGAQQGDTTHRLGSRALHRGQGSERGSDLAGRNWAPVAASAAREPGV